MTAPVQGRAYISPRLPAPDGLVDHRQVLARECLAIRFGRKLNSKLRDEPINGEIFYGLAEAKVVIEAWRRCYYTERPHSSPGYKPPAPEHRLACASKLIATAICPGNGGKPIMHQD